MSMKVVLFAVGCSALSFACSAQSSGDETQEIVDNLVQAGFPANDIQVVNGKVYTGRDAEVSQIVQPINRAAKCAFLCKGPDVQFIYDAFFPRPSGPCAVAPLVAMRVDDLTRPVHIIGLKA